MSEETNTQSEYPSFIEEVNGLDNNLQENDQNVCNSENYHNNPSPFKPALFWPVDQIKSKTGIKQKGTPKIRYLQLVFSKSG